MAVWIAIIVYYSFYSGCLIAKVIRMRKEHAETGERYDVRGEARTHPVSLAA